MRKIGKKRKAGHARRAVLAAASACLLALLTACGKTAGSGDVGGSSWVLSGGSQEDTQVTKEDMEEALGGEMVYSFEKDGSLKVELMGTEIQGSWSQDGGTVTVTSGDESRELTLDGDTMYFEQDGITVVFEKK